MIWINIIRRKYRCFIALLTFMTKILDTAFSNKLQNPNLYREIRILLQMEQECEI